MSELIREHLLCKLFGHRFRYSKPWFYCERCGLHLHNTRASLTSAGITAQQVWEYVTRVLTNLSDTRAAKIDNLDAAISSRLATASYTAERGTDNAMLAASYVTERGTNNAMLAASYVTERGTDGAALASSWTAALATALGSYTAALATALSAYTAAKAAFLDVAISSRLATASYTAERGTDNAMLAVNGALEATLTAIKGAGWTTQTLVAIKAAIDAIVAGATAAQVWAYATRDLTSYHISSDATASSLAYGAVLTPAAGCQFTFGCDSVSVNLGWCTQGIVLAGWDITRCVRSYQKYSTGAHHQYFENLTGVAVSYGYFWENVGASSVQPFKPAPGELVLEEDPGYIITVPEKWLMEHKAEIEADADDKLGYGRHRDVLIAVGFKMPVKK